MLIDNKSIFILRANREATVNIYTRKMLLSSVIEI